MLRFLQILVLLSVLKNGVSEEAFQFASMEDFIKFIEKWTKSESVEDFRRAQSKFIRQLMDSSVNPCQNFNDYACGNFTSIVPSQADNIHGTTIGASMSFSADNGFEQALKDDTENDTEIIVKLNNFYRSCMNDAAWKPEVAGKFIRNFADWPILLDGGSVKEFDWIKATAFACLHDCFTLFRHRMVVRNDTFYDSFEPVTVPAPSAADLKNHARAVGIDLTGKEREVSDLLHFLNEIHKLMSEYQVIREEVFHTISDLQKLYPKFDFLRFLQIIREPEAVSSDTVIRLDKPVYFRKLYDLITSTNTKIVANAIFAKVVTELLLARTDEFYERRSSICSRQVKWPFQIGLLIQFAENYLGQDTREDVDHLTMEILETADRLHPDKNVHNIKKNTFYPLDSNFTQFFMDFYQKTDIDPDDFYSNYFKTITASAWLTTRYIDRIFVLGDSYKKYFPGYGIVASVLMLVPPFYHRHAPDYVKFGALGSYIGHQIYRANSDDREAYKRSAECFPFGYSSQYSNNTECAATEGLKISVPAYKNWTNLNENRESTDIEVNGVFLNDLQALYISHAQSICSLTSERFKKDISRSYLNFPAFREAFHCREPNLS